MRIYLDSAPLIYVVEGSAPFASAVMHVLARPGVVQLCSELTRLECRVKPVRDGQGALLAAFDHYFAAIIDCRSRDRSSTKRRCCVPATTSRRPMRSTWQPPSPPGVTSS